MCGQHVNVGIDVVQFFGQLFILEAEHLRMRVCSRNLSRICVLQTEGTAWVF